jgi:MYXO-CTERM domain-containing protein
MLRALLGRFVPYAAALLVTLGCGSEGGEQEAPAPAEPVRNVVESLIGQLCPSGNECGQCEVCEGGTCIAAPAGTSCTSATDTDGVCDAPDTCDGNGVCVDNVADSSVVCAPADPDNACDAPDTCSGTDKTCVPRYAPVDTACTSATDTDGACDAPDTCDGNGVCVDNVADSSVVCAPADPDNACDAPDTCSGTDKTCVTRFATAGTACTSATDTDGPCDAPDTCDGNGACVDNIADSSVVCNPADPGNACDAPDTCSGTDKTCVTRFAAADTPCTSPTNTNGPCDAPDACDGNGVCVDLFVTDPSVVCAPAGADPVCDPADTCSGTSKACVPRVATEGTSCVTATHDPLNPCDAPDTCNGMGACVDRIRDSSTVCRPGNGVCDPDDHCTGVNKLCPEVYAPSTTACTSATHDPNNPCDAPDFCDGAGFCTDRIAAAGTICAPANGVCDPADTCTGTDKTCTVNVAPIGTACSSPTDDVSNPCDARDTCDGAGTCVDNIVTDTNTVCKPGATGVHAVCDPPDYCTGVDKSCPATFADDGTPCDSGNNNFSQGCEEADTCNGSGLCVDRVKPSTFMCQDDPDPEGPAGDCDADDYCDGVNKHCPELVAEAGKDCDDGFDCTVPGTSKCLGNGQCGIGQLSNALCPQPGDALGACAAWTCNPTLPNVPGAPTGCQITNLFSPSVPCRVAAPGDTCDITETCNGVDATCPPDAVKPSTEQCRAPSCSDATGEAIVAASCPGGDGKQCPDMVVVQCGAYRCNDDSTACRTSCSSNAHCIASHYCSSGTCQPRVGAGAPCENDSQCSASNPHCVDGVCCDTACKGKCQACNQQGSEGTCTVMPLGSQPVGDREPCKGDGTACDGYCNGTDFDECEYPGRETRCSDDACDPVTNVATVGAFCDGVGACVMTDPVECAPYLCGDTACNGDCAADIDCTVDHVCRAGRCVEKIEDGGACSRAAECESGFCVDGVCCNSRCDGQCEACNVGGKRGTCSAVTGAPVGSRPACAGSGDCAGSCDGELRSACTYPGRDTPCRAAGCTDGVATIAAVCNGRGACPAADQIECPSGVCEGPVCSGDECVIDAHCPDGEYCVAATCQPKLPPGGQCTDDTDCASGYCTDGVCCDSACLGQCEACDVPGSEGTCSPVPAGEAPHGTRAACTSDGSVCGGSCDGVNTEGCSYPVGDVCRPGSCDDANTGSIAIVEATCQGNGRCPTLAQQACGQYACTASNGQCDGPCANDPDACAEGEYCSAGICVEKRQPGEPCGGANECESGFCVDGVCCKTACGAQCEACDVAGSVGTCTPVTGPARGGRPGCQGSGPCGAACNGSTRDACGFAEAGASCGGAFCSNGIASEGQICDGAGRCTEGEIQVCLSYGCDGTVCDTACQTDADCTGENLCVDGKCILNTLIDARDEGTCGCRVPGGTGPNRGALALLGVAAAAALFRRRKRSKASLSLQ